MVLFSIACETCASRLNVKQRGAIGQVLACPKCGSMVHVQPPEDWVDPDPVPQTPPAPRRPRNPADSQATLSGEFGNLDSRPDQRQSAPGRRVAIQPEKPQQAPPVQDAPLMPDGNWTSESAKQRGKAVAWISGILGLCLLALVLILYMVTRMIGGEEPVTDPDKLVRNDINAEVAPDDPEAAAEDGTGTAEPVVAEVPPVPEENPATATEDGQPDPDPPSNPQTVPDTTTPPDNDATADDVTTSPDDVSTSPDDVAPSGKTEDPDNTPLIDIDTALQGTPGTAVQGSGASSVLDDLAGYSDLLETGGIDVGEYRQATTEDQTSKIGIGKVFVPKTKPLEVDFEKAVRETFMAVEYTDLPLIEVLRNIFRLTQVPVQLDTQAVSLGLLDPHVRVSGRIENGSALDLLQNAISGQDLTWKWNDANNTIIVYPRGIGELSTFEVPTDALVFADEEQATDFIAVIQGIVQPDSWNTSGGPGTLRYADSVFTIEQTGYVAQQTRDLLHKLNLAAKLKSDPDNPALAEQLATFYARSADLRNSSSTFEEIQLEPVFDIVNSVQRQDGLTLIVNWSELMKQDWTPRLEMPWHSRDSTIGETLRDLTLSMNLAYRLLGENVMEITSKQQLQTATRLEVYPCGRPLAKDFPAEQIISLLEKAVGSDMARMGEVHRRVEYLPQCQCIAAVLPDQLHIRIEKILNQLAGE